ncbi:MAG: hypothetical protein IGQ88_09190 [Gloeomargaritaceae cyanobacterium C42_A2020_066]|nr:hypothetical protein [Gloeomargaritaceae cyanobacterium C42_A2020_066]
MSNLGLDRVKEDVFFWLEILSRDPNFLSQEYDVHLYPYCRYIWPSLYSKGG